MLVFMKSVILAYLRIALFGIFLDTYTYIYIHTYSLIGDFFHYNKKISKQFFVIVYAWINLK